MKPISFHVEERNYRELKLLAERSGRAVAELIREAMAEYVERRRGRGGSLLDLQPHPSGAQLSSWSRSELLDEMLER